MVTERTSEHRSLLSFLEGKNLGSKDIARSKGEMTDHLKGNNDDHFDSG